MATTFIDFNDQTAIGRKISRGLQMTKEARDVIRDVIAIMQTAISGDASNINQFDLVVTEGGFGGWTAGNAITDAMRTEAKSSWDELNSLYAKLNCPGGQTAADVGPAITQACAKHGV